MSELFKYDPTELLRKYLTQDALDRYFSLLMTENRVVNLVSRETTRADFDRLVCESLLPLEILPTCSGRYLDIGSGAGIPAVPILLAVGSAVDAVLLERTQKKASALEHIIHTMSLTATIVARTFEEYQSEGFFDLITLRYVKLTPGLCSRILAGLSTGGAFVYYSTPSFDCRETTVTHHRFKSPEDQAIKSFTVLRKKLV